MPSSGKTDRDPTAPLPLSEQAYRNLRREIVNGTLPAGGPLRFEQLRERYGFSFSPLREALARLQAEHLVVATALRGFRVADTSIEEMWDTIETRVLIETAALRDAIGHATDEWEVAIISAFHSLSQYAGRLARAAAPADEAAIEEVERRHQAFHASLVATASSKWLRELSALLYVQTERYRRPLLAQRLSPDEQRRNIEQEHRDLLDACLQRDADTACALLAAHLRSTGRIIEQTGLPPAGAGCDIQRR
ncbi:MAG: GntR family transcriptional regulator [Burkholderiaceae bacterium]